ncbi:cytochrome c oxidase subunit 3 family protein [Saccharicrinis fermentans]|uniref:Cytochrome o ubiquinol oxidase subunit 3 n=1 Tax=Saccharicrinis fermentans DSM 9555 = JCM 21142 TaxID=869213 RepID=W7YJS7_9BACT|nr:cytochrome c oxidase subunit 3 family protein [Saccharicrinis fermentans]GAF02584.1 cytochrome o ubiquinol oxidase subunit 3 [Saccharicrinis fermentans DSM 9555 = JCM 21142]
MDTSVTIEHVHRDDEGSKLGMWLFIFTELLLFAGLFIVYGVYRYLNPEAFHLAAQQLSVTVGTINTVILLISSATIAMASSAIRLKNKALTLILLATTIIMAVIFMVNKYFEWSAKLEHGFFPSSDILHKLGNGDTLFFGLYFFMTGLHALHIVVGMVLISIVIIRVNKNSLTHENPVLLDNSGLYWHLVDIIWIFLFPLLYLIT